MRRQKRKEAIYMYEDLTLQGYLDAILSKEQQHILAYCLKNDVKVCLTDFETDKLQISSLFKKAGYIVDANCEKGNTVILYIKKEPFDRKQIEKLFVANNVKQWLEYSDDVETPKDYLSLNDVKNGRYPRIRYLTPMARFPERARIEQVVVVDMVVGTGKMDDELRQVKRYYTQKGTLIGELDRNQE